MATQKWRVDIQRKQNNYVMINRFFNRVVKIYLQHGTLAVAFYRLGEYGYAMNHPLAWLARLLHTVVRPVVVVFTGVDINPRLSIGPGFVIHNFSDVHVDAQSIGENLTLNQGVYIGSSWRRDGKPTLGNNVFVGAGAKILGNITVGDNVVIAANATVDKDVAANSLVAGVPGLVLKTNQDGDYVSNSQAHAR